MPADKGGKPKACNLSITLGCMLRCKICYHWKCDERDIIKPTLEQWKRFISSLQSEVDPDFTVVFGGGEPLMFPEMLLELISFAAGLGFRTALATSGHTISQEYALKLAESGLNNIDLTVFSLDRKTHDDIRGTDGSFDRVMRAIGYLSCFSDKMKIGINSIIMNPSLTGLLDLAEWVNSNRHFTGIYYQAITRPFHTPFIEEWYKKSEYSSLWPEDLTMLDSVLDAIIGMKKNKYRIANPISQFEIFKAFFRNPDDFIKKFTCNLIKGKFFAINSDGSVNLCPYMDALGRITEADFKDLWRSGHALSVKSAIDKCTHNCHHLVNCWYEDENHG